ncbi:hypothetical protein K461DRAFT_323536 [Myriangium duriaei CBS 260.36]|uniref:Uncharacterized protein n=1 Tax=Myriangium duriaei CBS 260.36 TaxID=1168546 RepID=A0A9P4IWW6_9PEZI|nr:hypothetical protein K461DRAFT_323536 [Myriangium duriaei CBS 260.36]
MRSRLLSRLSNSRLETIYEPDEIPAPDSVEKRKKFTYTDLDNREQSPRTVTIAVGGDLFLVSSGENRARFLVSSVVVFDALESLVLRNPLEYRWTSLAEPGAISVETSSSALEILLRAIHGPSLLLLNRPSWRTLEELHKLCVEYSCTRLVEVWVDRVVGDLASDILRKPEGTSGSTLASMAAVALSWSQKVTFHPATKALVYKGEGQLVGLTSGFRTEDECHLHPAVLAHIEKHRAQARHAIWDAAESFVATRWECGCYLAVRATDLIQVLRRVNNESIEKGSKQLITYFNKLNRSSIKYCGVHTKDHNAMDSRMSDRRSKTIHAIEQASKKSNGLCLECMQAIVRDPGCKLPCPHGHDEGWP